MVVIIVNKPTHRTMTPDVFTDYNKALINLVNGMFEDFDIKHILPPASRATKIRNGRLVCRHSKLGLEDIFKFLLQPRTESMNTEIGVFLELIDSNVDVTKEDFIIRRSCISPDAFHKFNDGLMAKVYAGPLGGVGSGRPILAFDGTTISLQQTPELMNEFGGHPGYREGAAGSPLSRTEVLVDTETECIVDAEFGTFRTDEGAMALDIIRRLPQSLLDRHPIALFDRKYCGFRTMYGCLERGIDFAIRVKRRFSKSVDDFIQSGRSQAVLELTPSVQSIKKHARKYPGEPFGTTVKVYLCRAYDGNQTVIIMSSFPLTPTDGAPLYQLRWKAESAIDSLKNLFQVEMFSGNRSLVVKQDFYARLTPYNLFYLFLHAATLKCLKLDEQKRRKGAKSKDKYAYRLNANASLHRFKEVFPTLCYPNSNDASMLKLIDFMTRYHEPIRPNRHLDRNFRAIKLFGKYITVQNYRRAI